MEICKVTIEGTSDLIQSRPHGLTKDKNETHEDFEGRIYKDKLHSDAEGNIFISPMEIKKALCAASYYRKDKIPGGNKSMYHTRFPPGIQVFRPMFIGSKIDDVAAHWIYCHGDPSKAKTGGSRVMRCFPMIRKWGGSFEVTITDDIITREIVEKTAITCGLHGGFGSFRVGKGGYCGAFQVAEFVWTTTK